MRENSDPMFDLIFGHSDWANAQLIEAASRLPQSQLDQTFDIGRGSLRRSLIHILAGETVWLSRWKGNAETPWPDEDEPVGVNQIGQSFRANAKDRDEFLSRITPGFAQEHIIYRDSKGSLFSATLIDMIIQMILHSAHHRAQAVNIFRRLGAEPPELDYMMSVRKPAR